MAIARDLLAATVQRLDIESAWTPRLSIDEPFAAPGAGATAGAALVRFVKPRIVVTLRDGTVAPLSYAPGGEPGRSRWPIVAVLLVVGILVVLVFVVRRLRG